jgi:hypothetical protein
MVISAEQDEINRIILVLWFTIKFIWELYRINQFIVENEYWTIS